MAVAHTFFATDTDLPIVSQWLHDAGGRVLSGESLVDPLMADGRELVITFPEIGSVDIWPEEIDLSNYEENSSRWRRAVLAKSWQRDNPGRNQLDSDVSAIAGLQLPELRDTRYWVAGHVCFPTSKLKEVFPELNRINQRLERFLKKHPIVFDNRKGKDDRGFDDQICQSGVVHSVYALPDAYKRLTEGAFMVDYLVSPKTYSDFFQRLCPSGDE